MNSYPWVVFYFESKQSKIPNDEEEKNLGICNIYQTTPKPQIQTIKHVKYVFKFSMKD